MITCEKFLEQLSSLIDGELDDRWVRELTEHCRRCSPCHVVYDTTRTSVQILGRSQFAFDIPADVSGRLHHAIEAVLERRVVGRQESLSETLSVTETRYENIPHRTGEPSERVLPAQPAADGGEASGAQNPNPPRSRPRRLLVSPWTLIPTGALAVAAAVTLWSTVGLVHVNGWLVDAYCAPHLTTATAVLHKRECDLGAQCRKAGYGVLTGAGEFLKFDPTGDREALQALQQCKEQDDVKVAVTGRRSGERMRVRSLELLNDQAETLVSVPASARPPMVGGWFDALTGRSGSQPMVVLTAARF
jgi:hypothetical protein